MPVNVNSASERQSARERASYALKAFDRGAHPSLECAPLWAVSSVVEHRLHTAGVGGSKPLLPTKVSNNNQSITAASRVAVVVFAIHNKHMVSRAHLQEAPAVNIYLAVGWVRWWPDVNHSPAARG